MLISRNMLAAIGRARPILRYAPAFRLMPQVRLVPCPTNRVRLYSSTSNNDNNNNGNNTATFKVDNPQLMIAFTCKKCDTRSSHAFSKQAYVKGTVLIQCPGCKGRHLIADNLKIFKDNRFNLEDVLNAKGESVATGTEDLVFEDIPESLKNSIGHFAKDAPEEYKKKLYGDDSEEIRALPDSEKAGDKRK